jgi:membrane-bound serine protease (ClpP class)
MLRASLAEEVMDSLKALVLTCGRALLLMLALGTAFAAQGQQAAEGEQSGAPLVRVMTLDGAIGPASADWFLRSLAQAEQDGAALFVLKLNTPGGLDKSMREIISAILDSSVPVATWVAPGGARAASAGTYILYASHVAAMAPATNLGSATPVQMGGGGSPMPTPGDAVPGQDQEQQAPADNQTAMRKKVVNDAVAYIRGLAELRGRNADWAEQAVREGESLTSSVAQEKGVIDLIATDLDGLIPALDGREVKIGERTVTLALDGYQAENIEEDWRTAFLAVITDPSIAYILLMVGIYGLIIEFYNPGVGIPGVLGAICLLTAMYALQMLPISYVGLGLILLGVAMMMAEAFSPSFGVLGVGGAIAFIIGSVMLMDTDLPGYQIAMPVIAAFGVSSVLVLSLFLRLALKTRHADTVSGQEGMIGGTATATEDFQGEGYVRAFGELWRARCDTPVRHGDTLTIRKVDGLILHVEA